MTQPHPHIFQSFRSLPSPASSSAATTTSVVAPPAPGRVLGIFDEDDDSTDSDDFVDPNWYV